ncbi:hypothetical protein G7Z17_g12327 [Cylindrodendrum hubeiense]|uniref:Formamidopyrimidine-DNA glycosylase catalytic domain-containing protein n=1 Tax=Cylindrodendrum hubeiense TaxID=595255 RepID=A0A9P5H156_9HYPO|nr:hypothetical protein G7Z17_g12327 [Cylindrodendrum hubeiense]
MPEIAEVARIVHFLRLHVVGKQIASASAIDDKNVFGKVGTTGAEVEAALKGKKQEVRESISVMHFGMTGWVHIKGEKTAYTNYYKKMKAEDITQWPPKFWKFQFATEGTPGVEVAFTDSRRFGRVRLVDCPGDEIRKHSPLVENGPDPVVDLDRFTEEYLRGKMRARHVPIKALLLDQAMISGIGNWVADETLYQAKLHPEQYCDEFDESQIANLYKNIRYVCQTSVDELGDSDKFPEHWLFNYRWSKGAKGTAAKLPNGEKLAFITVGGRTSCYAPGLQKKTGRTVPGIKEEPLKTEAAPEAPKKSRKKSTSEFWEEGDPPAKKKKRTTSTKLEPNADKVKAEPAPDNDKLELGQRRSTRLRK